MEARTLLKGLAAFLVLGAAFTVGAATARADEIVVEMSDMYEGDLAVDGFELKSKTTMSISAVGAELKNSDEMFAYGWIIDADSREPVWILDEQETDRYRGSHEIREYEDEITLNAGRYEVYYYVGRPYFTVGSKIEEISKVVDLVELFFKSDEDRREYYSEDIEDLMLRITAPEGTFTKFDPVESIEKAAIVDFLRPEDGFMGKQGFTLKKDMKLNIVAIGEYFSSDRVFVDYGWIMNADTRKRVWQMDKWTTSWAGGGRKNRGLSGALELPAGNYVAYFVTDDSHSFGNWNVMPPHDPLHYGMIIYPASENDIKSTAEFIDDYTEPVVVQITRVRNNQYKYKGFTLDEETDLHVVALGEYGYEDEFVDYGWIESVAGGDVVWKMTEDETEHAGGAAKNRRFDGIVTLPAGSYMVYYVSDGSHAYRRWNAAAPFDEKMWGITIYGAGKDFDSSSVKVFNEPPENKNVLVSLTGIGDDEEVREFFELDSSASIRVFALGEGRDGDMFDYGWIEDARTGEIIWEMTYRKTRYAGGGRKNRMVDARITLEAGQYYAFYVTDNSHSFPDFNTSRPDQPHKWGITITRD